MSRTTQFGNLRVEREMIPVRYLSDIDGNWKFTDMAGHEHRCDYDAADHWPTLREVIDRTYWCADCHDEHQDSHLECRQCGEHIRPGMTGPGSKMVGGRVSYYLNDEPIAEKRAEEIIRSAQGCGHAQ